MANINTALGQAKRKAERLELYVLADKNKKELGYDIYEVEKLTFKSTNTRFLNLGFKETARWIKIKIPPHIESKDFFVELEYPLLDSVSLFYKNKYSKNWKVKHSGDALPFYQRDINYHNLIFKVGVSPTDSMEYFFRIKTKGNLQFSVKFWNQESLFEEMLIEQIVFGSLFGVFLILIAYGTLIGSLVKTRAYLYFSMLVFSAALFLSVLNGYAFQYFWPRAPDWGNQALPFSIGVFTVSAINFIQLFLRTKKHAPVLQKLLQLSSLLAGLVASIIFVGYYNLLTQVAVANAVFAVILLLYTSIITRARDYAYSRFVVSGSYLFAIGVLLSVLKSFGIVDTTFITKHGVELGTVFFLLLCAVSLNDYYTIQKSDVREEGEG